MITRRTLVLALGTAALAPSLASFAQQPPTKVWRLGFFYFGSRKRAVESGRYDAFLRGMRELGYVEGKHFVLETRFADGKAEILPGLAADLLRSNVDLIVATGTPTYHALKKATTTIPIVITAGGDPVADGLAASLARPGGNITGLSNMGTDLTPKLLELLVIAAPKVSRVAVLLNPINGSHPARLKMIQGAAQIIRVNVLRVDGQTPGDIERAYATMTRERVQAVIILNDGFLLQQIPQIAALAIKHRLPSISATTEYPEAGGLMGYGSDIVDHFRRAATYVDKILKGARPAEMPIEEPTIFKLVINRKTATALGITLSQELLLRADRVIE